MVAPSCRVGRDRVTEPGRVRPTTLHARPCDHRPVNLLDLAALALVCTGLVLGVRSGAVPQLLGLLGAAVGIGIVLLLAPVARALFGGLEQPARALAAIGGVLLVVGLGEGLGSAFGRTLRHRYVGGVGAMVDGVFGGLVGVAQAVIVIWIVGGLLVAVPIASVAEQAQRSAAVRTVSRFLPPPSAITGEVARIVGSSGLPQLFLGLEPTPAAPVDLPSFSTARVIARPATSGVVRIEGTACGTTITGTGFAIAPGYVVTNAHVVAGTTEVVVTPDSGRSTRSYPAIPVLFDPALDIALLRVPGLPSASLTFARADPARGDVAAALGHPGGMSLAIIPAAVAATYRASGRDLYGEAIVDRQVVELRAEIEPGDSGGPIILADGTVGGVVFAESRFDPEVGYALAPSVVAATVLPAIGRAERVETGRCVR